MNRLYTTLVALLLCTLSLLANDTTQLYRIDIHQDIGSTTWRYLQDGMQQAYDSKSDAVILHLNTYGGLVLHADSMRTLILNAHIPVYAYIENNVLRPVRSLPWLATAYTCRVEPEWVRLP